MKTDFWAQLSRDDASTHGATKTSPGFESQRMVTQWVHDHQKPGDEVMIWRREITDSGFRDYPLMANDDPPADPERLATLIAGMRMKIELERGELRAYSRNQVKTAAERGQEARDRLAKAGAAYRAAGGGVSLDPSQE